jgi:DNA modification methylase
VLVHGDNLTMLRALAPAPSPARTAFGPIDLCYADPPYFMQTDHGVRTNGQDRLAYSDTWASASDYCQFLFQRLWWARRTLSRAGFLFVQCDWRASAMIRLMLDEVFGPSCFRNEIVWRRAPNLGRQAASSQLGRTADSILVYSRFAGAIFPSPAPTLRREVPRTRKGTPQGARWDQSRGAWFLTAPRGDYTDASIDALDREGRVYRSPTGTAYVKYFLESQPSAEGERFFRTAPVDTIWDDPSVRPLRHASKRELSIAYVTQKPESLLDRIVSWASPPSGLVMDPFCGSGTTLAVAQRLGRRWLGCDASELAIATTRARLNASGAIFDEVRTGAELAENPASVTRSARAAPRVRKPRVTRSKATR